MVKLNTKRHMSPSEIAHTADWIMDQPSLPSWKEVSLFVLDQFTINRTVEALRRIPAIKAARDAREAEPKARRVNVPKLTKRQVSSLEGHVARLEAEVRRLEAENAALLSRNLRLINGARVHQIPESDLDRPLAPINRNPTVLRPRATKP